MGCERIDYDSDEEYQHFLFIEQEMYEEWAAEEDEKKRYEYQCFLDMVKEDIFGKDIDSSWEERYRLDINIKSILKTV